LDCLDLAPALRVKIEAQGSRVAAAERRGRRAIEDAFLAGYRTVLWTAAGLALASSLSAAVLIRGSDHSIDEMNDAWDIRLETLLALGTPERQQPIGLIVVCSLIRLTAFSGRLCFRGRSQRDSCL
jgi:hypothetical protein